MNEQNPTPGDDLRARLAAADPARRASINPIPTSLMEQIMTTTTPTPINPEQASPSSPARRWKLPAAIGGAVSVAAAAIIGIVTLGGGDGAVSATPLQLSGGGDAMAMCMEFSVEILADMPIAMEATVTAVEGPTVTLDIDRWYRNSTGSDADSVVVNAPEGMESLIGGITFETGGQYLITATADGNVNYCGYTGVATDELRASFGQAFPG